MTTIERLTNPFNSDSHTLSSESKIKTESLVKEFENFVRYSYDNYTRILSEPSSEESINMVIKKGQAENKTQAIRHLTDIVFRVYINELQEKFVTLLND